MELTDAQWERIRPLIPKLPRRADGKGRPWNSPRETLNGILWVLRTGARWCDLPGGNGYPPYQSCHRWFQNRVEAGVMEKIIRALARDLKKRGKIDLTECFIDGTFVVAKKGARKSARPKEAREPG